METTDQLAEETRRVIRALQEGARRVNQIRELMEEHNCELAFEGEALEAAARRLAEEWDLVDAGEFRRSSEGLSNFVPAKLLAEEVRAQCASSDLCGCTGGTPTDSDIEVAPCEVRAVCVKQPDPIQRKALA